MLVSTYILYYAMLYMSRTLLKWFWNGKNDTVVSSSAGRAGSVVAGSVVGDIKTKAQQLFWDSAAIIIQVAAIVIKIFAKRKTQMNSIDTLYSLNNDDKELCEANDNWNRMWKGY